MRGLIRTAGFLGSLGLMAFWFAGINVHQVNAVDPPYVPPPPPWAVAWDPYLIPQKMAPIYGGDPSPYVTDGRFYDVGRNPNPAPGFPVTQYGDYRFRVTHIKFDWKNNQTSVTDPITGDVTTSTSYDEAQTIQETPSSQLAHVTDAKAKGEWIYKYATFDPDAGRNEPALYVTGKACKVQVRIECAAAVHHAYVGAKELRDPYWGSTPNDQFPRKWLDVERTRVDFREKLPGAVWVSQGPQIGSDKNGNPIYSEYVDLPLAGDTRADINRSDIIWQWYVTGVSATPIWMDEWWAHNVSLTGTDGWAINKSGKYENVTIIDPRGNPQKVEMVFPHRFYTILERSQYPWYDALDASNLEGYAGNRKPWITALEFAIVTPGRVTLAGETDITAVAARVTEFVYNQYALSYTHDATPSHWVSLGGAGMNPWGPAGVFDFMFSGWLSAGYGSEVNCHDQALAVTSLTALVGGDAHYTTMEPFGYVPPSDFVGSNPKGDNCNNPFFEVVGVFVVDHLVGADDTCWRTTPLLERKRSQFMIHSWMELGTSANGGTVYDATAGAASSGWPRMGISRSAFKTAAIDLSHVAVSPWEDNEEMAAKISGAGAYSGPAKDPAIPGTDNPDPNYKHGDMTKATNRTFQLR